jgi:signal transduction histidine kinase
VTDDDTSADALRSRISHDLRTPLAVIVGYAELLASRGDEPDFRREAASKILEAAERLGASLDSILELEPD